MSEITEEKAPAAKQDDPASEKEVINTFQTLRQEASQLFSKINELENEKAEHALVIDAIKDLDPKRKCFRLIGGVLVERTVEELQAAEHVDRFLMLCHVCNQLKPGRTHAGAPVHVHIA